jgi:hypothetical protein
MIVFLKNLRKKRKEIADLRSGAMERLAACFSPHQLAFDKAQESVNNTKK